MASVTLDDVKIAFYQEKDQRRAAEMLQIVLRQSPSAEAWYIAAQMTTDETKAIRFLRQALLLNPNHKLAKRMLERLGGTEAGLLGTLSSETADTVYQYSSHVPLLKRLPQYQQLVFAGLLLLVAGIFVVMTAQSVIAHVQQPQLPLEAEAPAAPAVTMVTAQQIIDQFNQANITLYNMQFVYAETAQNLSFAVADDNGAMYSVSIWVYDSISALIEDQTRINMQTATANVVGAANAFLIYPNSLPGATAQQLETTFRTAAGI